jgi:hypothetical protein
MQDEPKKPAHVEALRFLEAFTSTGAISFNLTITARNGEKLYFRRDLPPDRLRRMMPDLLKTSAPLERNLMIRPHPAPGIVYVQLDDLTAEAVEWIKPAAFLCFQTSPGNYQAWIAVRDGNPDFTRRLKKGMEADPGASGVTRLAGYPNFKDKYAPDFPRVAITHLAPGRIATKDELETLRRQDKEGQGLVAPREELKPFQPRVSPTRKGGRKWPSYQRCVDAAPMNRNKTAPDYSNADIRWCMTALDPNWGWTIEEAADKLMELSPAAKKDGMPYALRTAERAASYIDSRRAQVAKR